MIRHFRNIQKIYLRHTKSVQIIFFLIVFLFTFILRAHNYEKTPGIGHLEEQMYAWAGLYLLEEGVPVAWSSLDYPNKYEVYRGEINYNGDQPVVHVRLYRPWFDQPFLYSLMSGGVAHLFEANRHMVVPNAFIRIPSLIFATLTSIMVFLIASTLSGFGIGLLAMGLYGTIPILVFGSRLSVPENFIAFILAVIIFLLLKYQQKQRWILVIWFPILVGLAGLAKPTGYFLMPLVAFFAFKYKKWSQLIFIMLGVLPFVGAYILYGTHFDASLFWQIQMRQSFRPAGFGDLAWFFVSPAYDIFTLSDAWYIFCLLSAGYFLFQPPDDKKRLVIFGLFYWLIIVMISAGETDLLPWYRYPVFPLLAITGAWAIQLLWQRISFFSSLVFVAFFLGNRTLVTNAFRDSIQAMPFRLLFSGLMLPSLLMEVFKTKLLLKLAKGVMIAIFIVGLYWNVQYIYNRFELTCENITCPTGPSTLLSRLYFPGIYRLFVLGKPDRL